MTVPELLKVVSNVGWRLSVKVPVLTSAPLPPVSAFSLPMVPAFQVLEPVQVKVCPVRTEIVPPVRVTSDADELPLMTSNVPEELNPALKAAPLLIVNVPLVK